MKQIFLIFLITSALLNMPLMNHAQSLYTQTGSDSTWNYIISNNLIPVGYDSNKGITGSIIDVNQNHPEIRSSQYANRAIQENIAIHTLGNATVPRSDFFKWSRWYQEDGNTQVFRLFKDEINVRNSVSYKPRIEAELGNHVNGTTVNNGAEYAEWTGTYTVIQPPTQNCNIFQIWGLNNYALMLELRPGGKIVLNRRYSAGTITMIEDATGKSFDIMVRDYGTKWEVYLNGEFFEEKDLTQSNTPDRDMPSHFRWGMYHSDVDDGPIASDCMMFVTGAKFRYSNEDIPPPPGNPIVSIETTLPATLCTGHEYEINVTAIDTNGIVDSVELFLNGELLEVKRDSPYQFIFTAPLEKGSYSLKVIATDNDTNLTSVGKTIEVLNCDPFVISGKTRIEAEDYTDMYGIKTEETEDVDGDLNVGWTQTGDWLDFMVDIDASGTFTLDYRVASNEDPININLLMDGVIIDNLRTSTTNGWQNWKTASSVVDLDSGIHRMRIYFIGRLNINYLDFIPGQRPLIAFKKPLKDTAIIEDYNLEIHANASDAGGSITKVELYIDDVLFGTDNLSPYNFGTGIDSLEIKKLKPGIHVFKLISFDNDENTNETSLQVTVNERANTSIVRVADHHDIAINPNPVNSHINIELKNIYSANIIIYNMHGKMVYQTQTNERLLTIPTNILLQTGMYLIKVIDGLGKVHYCKVLYK